MAISYNFALMKKLLLSLMICMYCFSSSGASVQLHYCCGKLQNITFGSIQEKDCGMQQEMTSGKCCETKSLSAKDNKGDQEFYNINIGTKTLAEPLPVTHSFQSNIQSLPEVVEYFTFDPPLFSKPLFILNCVFRI